MQNYTEYPEYPYNSLYRSEEDVENAFARIVNYPTKFVSVPYKITNIPDFAPKYKLNGVWKYVILAMEDGDYDKINWLSNMFNEHARVRAKRYDEQMSPFDYFQKNAKFITRNFQRDDYQKMSDEIYNKIRGCNTFRANVAKIMIEYYNAKSVLDFSAGWGDRLIGAIAAGVRYVGVDPNVNLHDGYARIIERFAQSNQHKYTMICSPFEGADLPTINPNEIKGTYETYDMVLTSPPYFDLEQYSSDATQSIALYKNIDVWFHAFLMESIKKAWDVLNPNGHMIIIINDAKGRKPYVSSMLNEMERVHDAEYLGVIAYADKMVSASQHKGNQKEYYKSPQPMWIWKKRA